ncbi:hypothetical protein PENSPDRAFT_657424 [Peniophora sp. CONT]|nr:hypothetical protein PENSPDRAFT_657424 [Peniophora sp. CONT]
MEGEVHLKGAGAGWDKLTITLVASERAHGQSVELHDVQLVLYDGSGPLPSVLPFALNLTPDAAQCTHTPVSALEYVLTATLSGSNRASVIKKVEVHARRFSPHNALLPIGPVRRSLSTPASLHVELPRTSFFANEPVAVYVTVPPPPPDLVLERGLRLRNIKAELVRTVRVGTGHELDDYDPEDDEEQEQTGAPLGVTLDAAGPSSSAGTGPEVYRTVVSRSGALCRFHTSRPVRLRFVLQQSSPAPSPTSNVHPLPAETSANPLSSSTGCASVSQRTLMHSVSFRLRVLATFRHTRAHAERVAVLSVPIRMVPPPAPLPEVAYDVDAAYAKKHDKPPARTVRAEEGDAAPGYDEQSSGGATEEAEAGPSYTAAAPGAPPPFEPDDAPPPFSHAASSSRLPTFLESEQAHTHPHTSHHTSLRAPYDGEYAPEGEGTLFGFRATDQFSGHADEILEADIPPPPTLAQATLDADVTALARLELSAPAMRALVSEHARAGNGGMELGMDVDLEREARELEEEGVEGRPPPPPAMDDPADPPPSIDSAYRPPLNLTPVQSRVGDEGAAPSPSAHAPPPYLGDVEIDGGGRPPYVGPGMEGAERPSYEEAHRTPGAGEGEGASGPPPYVDFIPASGSRS